MPSITFSIKKAGILQLPYILEEIKRTHETQVQRDLAAYFQIITGDWKHAPKLHRETIVRSNAIVTTVRPTGANVDIWKYVTRGTRKHIITSKRAKFLRFMWGGPGSYIPKTRPGGQYGGPGVVKDGTIQHRKKVNHPGNKGRFFERKIVKEYRPKYIKLMREAIKRGVRAAEEAGRK